MQLQNWIILFRKRHGVWLFYCPMSRNIVKILKLQLFHFISYYSEVIIKVGQLFCDQSIKVSQDTGIIGRYQRGVKIFENWWTIYKELSVLNLRHRVCRAIPIRVTDIDKPVTGSDATPMTTDLILCH